jgi:nucleotide-binding universal stress UspA family protein
MYNVLQKEGEAALDKAKTSAAAHGVTLSTHLKFGHAGSEIIALADTIKADLIIVGSHGKSQTDRLLIGSVSTFIVTHSKVSTMVVRS